MPYLVDQSGIQILLEMHTDEQVEIHNRGKPNFAGSDTDTGSYMDPLELQEMVSRHSVLVEEGLPLSENGFCAHGEIVVNHDPRRMMATMGVDIASDGDADRFRTGGGGYLRLPIGGLGRAARAEGEDLIGEPIDPQRGQLEADNGKTVVARTNAGAESVAPEEMGSDAGDAASNGEPLTGERSEWRKKNQISEGGKGAMDAISPQYPATTAGALDGRTTAVEVGDIRKEALISEDDMPQSGMSIAISVLSVETSVLEDMQQEHIPTLKLTSEGRDQCAM